MISQFDQMDLPDNTCGAKLVPESGPLDAPICLVGEAPGQNEVAEGKPFVGAAGSKLVTMLANIGATREDVRILNVVPYRPSRNNFGVFYKNKTCTEPTEFLFNHRARLAMDIARGNHKVIIALGNEAMKALTNGAWTGINKFRGSICRYNDSTWMVPTFHPAGLLPFRSPQNLGIAMLDLQRAQQLVTGKITGPASFKPRVLYQKADIIKEVNYLINNCRSDRIAFDIETAMHQVTAISFAWKHNGKMDCIVIPFFIGERDFFNWSDEAEIWDYLRLLFLRNSFVAHNIMYDASILKYFYGLDIPNIYMDTMLAHHDCYLEFEKSLKFVTSLYTLYPYYKDALHSTDPKEFLWYNGMDSVTCLEVSYVLDQELRSKGLFDFYHSITNKSIHPLLEMVINGIGVDHVERKSLLTKYRTRCKEIKAKIAHLTGKPKLNIESSKQLIQYLYRDMKIPAKTKRDKKTGEHHFTADEKALEAIKRETRGAIHTFCELMLEFRKLNKLTSTYLDIKFDKDKRLRGSYNIAGTESGRISSQASNWNTGTNLQNLPSSIKYLFTARPGCVLMSPDLSQAENRIVAYRAGVKRMQYAFENNIDIHSMTAAMVYGLDIEDVTNDIRQIGKKCNHALNYAMGVNTFAKNADIPVKEARGLWHSYHQSYPELQVWHKEVIAAVRSGKPLRTCLGRERFFYGALPSSSDGPVYKTAISFEPQATIADLLNIGMRKFYDETAYMRSIVKLLLQIHDSIVVEVPNKPALIQKIGWLMKSCLEIPITVMGTTITIPCDIQIGPNMGSKTKLELQ